MKKTSQHSEFIWYPPLLGTILYGIYVLSTNFSEPENFSWIFLTKTIIQFYCYLFIIDYVDRWVNRKSYATGKIAAVLIFMIAWVLSIIIGLLLYIFLKQAFIIIYKQNDQIGIYHIMTTALSITVGYVLIYALHAVSKSSRKQLALELRKNEFEKEQLRLNYELMYNKLEPHFLFNNLNTLHSLIVNKNVAAESFVMSLSKVMRYSHQSQEKVAVSIDEEVEVFKHYMTIIKERVGDCLSYEIINKTQNPGLLIPMTLSNLLENIVKHNEISEQKPMHVKLMIDCEGIEISNTIHLKNGSEFHQGGLHTLGEMYRIRTGSGIKTTSDKGVFKVKLNYIDS